MSIVAYIGVGANLGFARDAVLNALVDLGRLQRSEFVAASGLYQSAPVGGEGPDYINAIAEIKTELGPEELLAALHAIERSYGRVRTTRNAPRTLDLDLLIYGDVVQRSDELTLPHPRLGERAFVLLPLLELAPELEIPGLGSIKELAAATDGQQIVRLDD